MWIIELGRAFRRISAYLFLAAVIGLPFAVILPNRPGLVLLFALFLAGVARTTARSHRAR